MPRYKCIIEYIGINYHGMQKQNDKNLKTIQSQIEIALFKLTNLNIEIGYSGRTDTGVNAKGQVIHFNIPISKNIKCHQIVNGLNHFLKNEDITITSCDVVNDDFDSRFDAKLRTYKYFILNRDSNSAIYKNITYHVKKSLNIEKMQIAASFFIGKHDFSAFRKTDCQSKNPIKTIECLNIEKQEDLIIITISAKSFLHNMVRIICGTLIDVGLEKIDPKDIQPMIESRNRAFSGKTLPPYGLFFWKVEY